MAKWYASFHMSDSKTTLHKMQGSDATEEEFVRRCQAKAKQLGLQRFQHVIRVGTSPNKVKHSYPVK